jgi:hypothetical protein
MSAVCTEGELSEGILAASAYDRKEAQTADEVAEITIAGKCQHLIFFWLYIAKKTIFETKSAKIKCLLRFSIAIIRPKLKKNPQILYAWFKYG